MDTSLAQTLSETQWKAMPKYLSVFLHRLCEREWQERQQLTDLELQMEAVAPLLQGQSAESVFHKIAALQSETRELADEVRSLAKVVQLNHDEKIREVQSLKESINEIKTRLTRTEQGAKRREKQVDEWHESLSENIQKAQSEVQRRGVITARLGEHLMREMTEQSVERQDMRVMVDNAVLRTRKLGKDVENVSRANNTYVGVVNSAIEALKADINAIRLAIATKSSVIAPSSSVSATPVATTNASPSSNVSSFSSPSSSSANVVQGDTPFHAASTGLAPKKQLVEVKLPTHGSGETTEPVSRVASTHGQRKHNRGSESGRVENPFKKDAAHHNAGDQAQYWGFVRDEVMREMKSIGNSYYNTIRIQCNEAIHAVSAAQQKHAREGTANFAQLKQELKSTSDAMQATQSELLNSVNLLRNDMQFSAADTEKKLEEQVSEIARLGASLHVSIAEQVRIATLAQEKQNITRQPEDQDSSYDVALQLRKLDEGITANRRLLAKNHSHAMQCVAQLAAEMRGNTGPEWVASDAQSAPSPRSVLGSSLESTNGSTLRTNMAFDRSSLAISGRRSKVSVAKGRSLTPTASSSGSTSTFQRSVSRKAARALRIRATEHPVMTNVRQSEQFGGNVERLIRSQAESTGVPFA